MGAQITNTPPMNKEIITLFDARTPVAITSSTDATPIVITATAHGLATGDIVQILGHTTNVAANGRFRVTKLTANTFSIQDEFTGADVAGSGAGAGASGILFKAPPIINLADYTKVILQVGTSGTATTTLKVAASLGKSDAQASGPRGDMPNFGATVSPSNPDSFLGIYDLLDVSTIIVGGTGIAVSGTDINKMYGINFNVIAAKYLSVYPVSWSAGAITVKAFVSTV